MAFGFPSLFLSKYYNTYLNSPSVLTYKVGSLFVDDAKGRRSTANDKISINCCVLFFSFYVLSLSSSRKIRNRENEWDRAKPKENGRQGERECVCESERNPELNQCFRDRKINLILWQSWFLLFFSPFIFLNKVPHFDNLFNWKWI